MLVMISRGLVVMETPHGGADLAVEFFLLYM